MGGKAADDEEGNANDPPRGNPPSPMFETEEAEDEEDEEVGLMCTRLGIKRLSKTFCSK